MNQLRLLLLPLIILLAGVAAAVEPPAALQLKPDLQQPYIVKKGDTLWDIADHFFRDPHQWLKIWEHNLTITNPDLIYPGNKIWFDGRKQATSGGLTTVRPHPQVRFKPVERDSAVLDRQLVLGVLARQDLIAPQAVHGVGYVLGARDGRLHFGVHDQLYIRLDKPAAAGDLFDLYRPGETITPPGSAQPVGMLILHLGQLQVESKSGDIYRAKVVRAFQEIDRGDFLRPARVTASSITPAPPAHRVQGRVIYIRDNAAEAGQNQVVAIDIGTADGMRQGTELQVFQQGREVADPKGDATVRLPSERIATLVVISPQQRGSLALVTQSATSINVGDEVRGAPAR